MADKEFHPTLFNPFMMWTDMAMKTTEMMVSSSQLIGERVDELARASANPSRQDQQLTLLAPERTRSVAETGLEMMTRLQNTGMQMMTRAWQQWFSTLATMTSVAGGRSFGQVLEQQDRIFQSLTQSGSAMANAGMQAVSDATPKPVRSAETANARRASRVSRTRVSTSRR